LALDKIFGRVLCNLNFMAKWTGLVVKCTQLANATIIGEKAVVNAKMLIMEVNINFMIWNVN
jgi:hypothetical protein